MLSRLALRQARSAMSIAVFALAPVAALAGPLGFSVQNGDLIAADLATGRVVVVGATGFPGLSAFALTEDGAGHLFALSADPGQPAGSFGLYRLDAATGAATRIGPLPGAGNGGLEVGPDGQLYLAVGPNLFRLDPATAAQTAFFPIGSGEILALATSGGVLYGAVSGSTGCHLDQIDPVAQTATPVMPNISCAFSMAGDGDGGLWLVSDHNGVVTGVFSLKVEHVDPIGQQVERWGAWDGFLFDSGIAQLQSLAAVAPLGGPVDVPTAGAGGLVLLAFALAGVGLLGLRR